MLDSSSIEVFLPLDLRVALDRKAETDRQSHTDIVIAALRAYLELEPTAAAEVASPAADSKVERLGYEMELVKHRLASLERAIAFLRSTPSTAAAVSVVVEDDDEIEDEPDEILTDFLYPG